MTRPANSFPRSTLVRILMAEQIRSSGGGPNEDVRLAGEHSRISACEYGKLANAVIETAIWKLYRDGEDLDCLIAATAEDGRPAVTDAHWYLYDPSSRSNAVVGPFVEEDAMRAYERCGGRNVQLIRMSAADLKLTSSRVVAPR